MNSVSFFFKLLNEIWPEIRPEFLTFYEMALNILQRPLGHEEETGFQIQCHRNLVKLKINLVKPM